MLLQNLPRGIPLLNVDTILKKLTRNSPQKIVSLVMAIFLFMFHNINLLKSKTISSKLQIEGQTNLIITNIIPENVSVTLLGNEEDISGISGDDIITFIDISAYTEKGSYRVPVQIIKAGNVLNIDTLEMSVEPVDIRIQLDNMLRKFVRISPAISGSPAAGYDLVSENVEPSQIQIEGPETSINSIDSVTTVPLDISDRYSDFSTRLEIVIPGQLFTIDGDSHVEYRATIRPAYVSKYFSNISLKAVDLDESFTAEIVPDTGGITLHGKYTDIENFVPADNLLTIDCSKIKDGGDFELPVKVDAGGLFEAASYTPETAVVKVSKREE
jgi:YbbR domain-containing protein